MGRSKIEWRDHVWPLAIVAVLFASWWFGWIGSRRSGTRRLIEKTTELIEKGEERNKEFERQLSPDP